MKAQTKKDFYDAGYAAGKANDYIRINDVPEAGKNVWCNAFCKAREAAGNPVKPLNTGRRSRYNV